jgi:hypothetical protein
MCPILNHQILHDGTLQLQFFLQVPSQPALLPTVHVEAAAKKRHFQRSVDNTLVFSLPLIPWLIQADDLERYDFSDLGNGGCGAVGIGGWKGNMVEAAGFRSDFDA